MNSLTESYLNRFNSIARLYGNDALMALSRAHFVVIGLGGVGTWTAEALARSGVGELTLIELDDVCVSNTNRQSHALQSTIGKPKNQIICQRLLDINPEIVLHQIDNFVTKKNMSELIFPSHHVVIDAMDASHIKAALAAYCRARKIRLVMIGSSGGKQDPQQVTVADLGRTQSDPMLAKIRNQLYRIHNFERENNRKFKIDVVYSNEQMVYPQPDGSVCQNKQMLKGGMKLDCAGGFGSSVMVTGTFGFIAAQRAIDRYLTKSVESYKK